MIEATLCHIIANNRILLQRKSQGRFGAGKWNGPGGKMEPGESPLDSVRREVLEETGLELVDPRFTGVLDFFFDQRERPDWRVYVFKATSYRGEPRGGGEGELAWFPVEDIPYGEMWEDDAHWLPLVLEGRHFRGWFWFQGEKLVDHRLTTW